jgi:predicted  nucleic acid-binding Zn-ribbon protein
MGSEKKFGWIEFLTGFAAGSVVSILFTRKELKNDFAKLQRKAEEIKNQLINKAKSISSDLTERSQRFIESSKKFADGKYAGTIESLGKEYYSIKYAINTAIDNYSRSSRKITAAQSEEDDLFINFEDETLPKFVGMGRRKR